VISYFNGQFCERSSISISPDDRGFVFADGLYEVIRSYDGALFRCEDHLDRLATGLGALHIAGIDVHQLQPLAERLLRENGLGQGEALIYLQITRGCAPRAHRFPPTSTRPTVFMDAKPFEPQVSVQSNGGPAVLVPDQRWARCDLKTVGLLPNCLAHQRATEADALEALFVRDGAVLEGSRSNVFFVKDDRLWTAPLTNYILPGITRGVVLEAAERLGLPVCLQPCFEEDLPSVQECFVTATTVEITPITSINGQTVGKGKSGRVTQGLQAEFLRIRTGS
jgi:D-alanine transaminase